MNCPYCGFLINPKNPKAGRFQPKCPKCAGTFLLVIPADVSKAWQITPIAGATDVRTTQQVAGLPLADASNINSATEAAGGFDPLPAKPAPPVSHHEMTGDYTSPPGAAGKTRATVDPTKFDRNGGTQAMDMRGEIVASADGEEEVPRVLGGYEIERELGRGGMGSVYLARQVSLDRDIALKIMNAKWASDPIFLARFTREAYAAAQLVHHNVVQIYDIGEDKGINFFSMEFVEGRSLGDLVKKKGKMDPREAVSFILQAARGLKFAHDRGMIHRDVKPDNLMLNVEGIVKVADLGLVKTSSMVQADDRLGGAPSTKSKGKLASVSGEMTHAHSAMGSPAYMSPEQCRDAAHVDLRADVYSLGCTLYVLLTGRPPFQGETALEVMSKHAMEPAVPPHELVKEVPPEISAILMRMIAKNPDERYATMKVLIDDLESYLGGAAGKVSQTTEEQISLLEMQVEQFNAAPAAKVRKLAIRGFFAASLLGGLASLVLGYPLLGLGIFATLVQTVLAYFVIEGVARKTPLFRKVREWLFGNRLTDWLTLIAGVGLLAGAIYISGLAIVWIVTVILSALWAFAFHFAMDRKVASQRQPMLDEAGKLFKRWRIQGMAEEKLRNTVAKFAGNSWEEFYESLFGYPAKIQARNALAETEGGDNRVKYAPWRDELINRIDAIQQGRREAKERRHLEKIEEKKLEAEGVDRREAKAQANARAGRMVEKAAEVKAAAAVPKSKIVKMNEAIDDTIPLPKKAIKPLGLRIRETFGSLVGAKLRFILGALLIAGGALWIHQNIAAFKIDLPRDKAAAMGSFKTFLEATDSAKPLTLPIVPAELTNLFSYFNPLLAGLLLILSLLFRGRLMSICFLAGAAVAFVGHQFIPGDLLPFKAEWVSMLAGFAIALIGYLLARRKGA